MSINFHKALFIINSTHNISRYYLYLFFHDKNSNLALLLVMTDF